MKIMIKLATLLVAFALFFATSPVSAKQKTAPLNATCTPKTAKVMSGTYRIVQAPYTTYVDYQVKYDVKGDCSIVNVSDRVRYRGTVYSEIGVTWFQSCSNSGYSCLPRGVNIGWSYVNKWTSWKSLPNTKIGNQYRNYSGFVSNNMSYGYTYFAK